MDAYNGTENYTYTCTSDTSEITFSGALQSGMMKLKVTDPNNQEVFNKSLTSISGNVYSVNAPAGDWNVSVQGVNANGTWTTTLNIQD